MLTPIPYPALFTRRKEPSKAVSKCGVVKKIRENAKVAYVYESSRINLIV